LGAFDSVFVSLAEGVDEFFASAAGDFIAHEEADFAGDLPCSVEIEQGADFEVTRGDVHLAALRHNAANGFEQSVSWPIVDQCLDRVKLFFRLLHSPPSSL